MERVNFIFVSTTSIWFIEIYLESHRFNTTKEHKKCTDECEEKTQKLKEHDEKLEAIAKERHEKEEKIKEDIA